MGDNTFFLGMNIRYTEQDTAVITMKEYLRELLVESNLNIVREAATPATRELFEVSEKATPLTGRRAIIFHSVVSKLLYVAIRARMDLLLAVGFLCTRVSKSTVEDESKLRRLLEYIKGSIDKEYTMGADDLHRMRSWVDASYAVHPNMRSHTGGVISLGRGGLICKSSKQKINTKSSTEAEVVGASDYLPHTLWAKMFMEAQGHKIYESILEQDNESAIKMEKMGRHLRGHGPDTSTSGTSGSRTEQRQRTSRFATVSQRKCWRISSPNLCKGASSVNFVTPFWERPMPIPYRSRPLHRLRSVLRFSSLAGVGTTFRS